MAAPATALTPCLWADFKLLTKQPRSPKGPQRYQHFCQERCSHCAERSVVMESAIQVILPDKQIEFCEGKYLVCLQGFLGVAYTVPAVSQ